jgi:hypothetical protein
MRRCHPIQGVVALVATVTVPAVARAQVDIVPALGYYNAVGGFTQQEDDGTGFPPLRRQLGALLLGTRVSFPLSSRLAVQATAGVTPSQVAVSTASGTVDINSGVFLASARALFTVVTLTDGPAHRQVHWDFLLGGGVGVVHRAGTAWEQLSGTTDAALVLEAGFGVGAFRLSIEDYISWAQFDGGEPTQTRAKMHHDLIGSLGWSIRLGGGR